MLRSRHAGGVPTLTTGQEWLVDASGCAPERLKDAAALAALNVYCCRTRARPDFESLLARHLGAASSHVRELKRGGVA